MLQKFIRKVEVGVNSVKIHWIVDHDHFDRELALKRASSVPQRGGSSDSGFFRNYDSYTLTFGARVEQVGEHLFGPSALFIFEYECYPEAKILSSTELWALHHRLGSWVAVGALIGASEGFARQNAWKR